MIASKIFDYDISKLLTYLESPTLIDYRSSNKSVTNDHSLPSLLIDVMPTNDQIKRTTNRKRYVSISESPITDTRKIKKKKELPSTVISSLINDFSEPKEENVPLSTSNIANGLSKSNKSLICVAECNNNVQSDIESVNDKDNNILQKALLNDSDTRGPKEEILIEDICLLPSLIPNRSLYQQFENFTVIVNNEQIENLSYLQVFFGSSIKPSWCQCFYYKVVALAITPVLLVIYLEDGSLHIFYIIFGVRASPILAPPSPIARLYAKYNLVMIISCYGDVLVWEVLSDNFCQQIISTSIDHLISPNSSILSCELHDDTVCLKLTNSKGYIYNKNTDTWLLVNDNHDPVWQSSAKNCVNSANLYGRVAVGQLAVLQRDIGPTPNLISLEKTSCNQSAMISYFELQLLASKLINSSEEYIYWLKIFVTYLCSQDNVESHLRSLLDELLGSHHFYPKILRDPNTLDYKMHELLKEVLKIIQIHVRWQSLYSEYKEKLEDFKKNYPNASKQ